MQITDIIPISQSRYRVCVEGREDLVLYKGELNKYRLKADSDMPEQLYDEILDSVLKLRARKRAMKLLERADRTEKDMYDRLEKDGYPSICVEEAIAYVKRFGYLDDDRYIENFIRSKSGTKSRKEIEFLLFRKGLSKERTSEIFDRLDCEVGDRAAIESLMRKKRFDPVTADEEKRRKMVQYLMRKGFRYEDIRQLIKLCNN
jgi:regulatory protein